MKREGERMHVWIESIIIALFIRHRIFVLACRPERRRMFLVRHILLHHETAIGAWCRLCRLQH